MTLAKAKATDNKAFIVQASLAIVTYDHRYIFIVKTIGNVSLHNCLKAVNQLPRFKKNI